jgi:hypothetical protein
MHLKEKINLKKYISFSIALLLMSYGLCTGPKEFLVVSTIFVAVILNQWMLLSSVDAMVIAAKGGENKGAANIIFSFLFKLVILIIAISFGVHIMENRIIIPILIYVAQIFVLYFSLK